MKKSFIALSLALIILTSLVLSQEVNNSSKNITIEELKAGLKNATATNKWNETVIISPTWQKVLSGFFGLNLKKGTSAISVREAIVLFMIFILFFVIISGITKLIPFFNKPIFGFVKTDFLAAIIITLLVSISGAFISLKNVFLNSVSYITESLDIGFMTWSLNNWWGGAFLALFIWLIIWAIREGFDWLEPFIKKYSEISRGEAKGRALNTVIKENAPKEVLKE